MNTTRFRTGIGFGVAAAAVLIAGCTGPSVPSQSHAAVAISGAATVSGAAVQGSQLVVLAEGSDGVAGLWALDDKSVWTWLTVTPGATALGAAPDGIALATGHEVEIRPRSALGTPGAARTLNWVGAKPAAPIVALDSSKDGKLILVTADAQSLGYAVAAPDGTTTPLSPAPDQSFTPSAAWLDNSRLLVLATDSAQVSRLAVADTGAKTLNSAKSVSGVRVMSLSGDQQTACVATETSVIVGAVDALLGTESPTPSLTIVSSHVVWGLTLDTNGSHLYMLSGTLADDGNVGGVKELGYAKQGSGWVQVVASDVPFGRAIGQVLLD